MTSSKKESLGDPLKILKVIDQWRKKDLTHLRDLYLQYPVISIS